ncbi:ethanolamine utilization protein [Clostridium tagluense]|uniref:Cobalamin adenosyltransferase n=1 Tax=Clostridium tagluense TaxID=360422 RepID=A0A401UH78_9CLOT|nr:ethanolamine utilization protein [Clostridium tagluense]GCD08832.1 hypothetical protein Ctaglu_04550 [Clostridium tagluense]
MKFITESDLRDFNKIEPFTTYELEPGARLTPGARQFLSDHRINMYENDPFTKKSTVNVKEKQPPEVPEKKNNWKKKKLSSKMKSMEALFLLSEQELLSEDVFLAQRVINLGKQFTCIKNAAEGKGSAENLSSAECTGVNADKFSDDLDDCFEITEFHMQLAKGREIIILHRLRCNLREIEPVVLEVYEGSNEDNELCIEIIGKVNQIVNTLSQIICSVLGGGKCQKKS